MAMPLLRLRVFVIMAGDNLDVNNARNYKEEIDLGFVVGEYAALEDVG